MALLQASARANSQAEISSSWTPCSRRKSRTSTRAALTASNSHGSEVRNVTQTGAQLASLDMSLGFDNLEDLMEAGQLKDLLNRRRGIHQPHRDGTAPIVDELVN